MSDRAALYAAVCANPDEDTPRLVLADWLQENGDEKRAAFIRAQVDRYRRVNADSPVVAVHDYFTDCDFTDLGDIDWSRVDAEFGEVQTVGRSADEFKLWPAVRGYGLPRIRGVDIRYVERGFHTGLWVEKPPAFLKHVRAIFRAVPITHVWFEALTAEQAREFVNGGYLAQLRRLSLGGAVEPEAVRVIGDHRDAAGVTWLGLRGGDQPREQVAAFVAGANWSGITRLEVIDLDRDDALGSDRMFAEILRRPQFRRLRHLTAYGNSFGDVAARAIATAGLTELRFLDLSLNDIKDAGVEAIARSKSLPNLRYLDLDSNDFGGAAGAALMGTPKLSKLTVLRLDGNEIRGVPQASAWRAPTLRVLSLSGGDLTDRGLGALGKCPALRGLWFLSLQQCGVTDAGIAALTKAAVFEKLTAFDLSDNHLTERGMRALARWPSAASLQSIDISDNKPGESGAKALVASEYFKGIKRINASGRGTARLRKHFGKKVVP